MSEQENLAIVRKGYEAFGRGDLDTLVGLFDDQIEWITPGPADLPIAGRRRGKAQVTEFFQSIDTVLEMLAFEPQTFIAQGEQVVVFGKDRSRVKATGATLDYEWAHLFVLRNGRVVRFQEYGDTAPLVAELRAGQKATA